MSTFFSNDMTLKDYQTYFSLISSTTFSGPWIAVVVVILIIIGLVCVCVFGRHRRRGDARMQDVEGIEMQNEFGERAEENPYEIVL